MLCNGRVALAAAVALCMPAAVGKWCASGREWQGASALILEHPLTAHSRQVQCGKPFVAMSCFLDTVCPALFATVPLKNDTPER